MKKLKNAKGFTLVETLTCMLMLVILGGICSTGMEFAMKCYQETVFESNSQTLASSLEVYMSDILRYATDVKTTGSADADGYKVVTGFTNPVYQMYEGMIAVSTEDETSGKMVIYTRPAGEAARKEYLIVGHGMYAEDMYITDFILKYKDKEEDTDEEKHYFIGEYKIKSELTDSMVRTYTFGCRTISE